MARRTKRNELKILVVGCGSIGRRHIRNLVSIPDEVNILACDVIGQNLEEVENIAKNIRVFSDYARALEEGPSAVFICTPNHLHLSQALSAARAGCHLFVEKPLAHTLDGTDELVGLVRGKNLKFLMGSNWKFHPSFKLMKKMILEDRLGKVISFNVIAGQYLPSWHPQEDYRKGYSAQKSLGGGVLLDSHAFDYVQWFLGPIKKISCIADKYSALEIDTEDVAEMIVEIQGGIVGSIHLDYVQHPYRRSYFFYGEKGTLEWDFRQKRVSFYSLKDREWQIFEEAPGYDVNQMYLDEMNHFIGVLNGNESSETNILDAENSLMVIHAAKRSSETGRVVAL